jgi:uncharacterized protein YodC (DUF2158 family)
MRKAIESLNPGDVVTLKDNAPDSAPMTVNTYHSDTDHVTCAWFDGISIVQAQFPAEELVKIG